jgi:AraC family transcriptional regulator, positive regulator of tynA and feaB
MKRIFSTDDVHPRDRFDFWHSVACATIVGHDSVPAIRNGFSADIDAGALAETGVVRFENSQMRVFRTAAQISEASSDEIFVCRQNAGSLSIDQDGRSATMQPGELVLLDPLLPYTANFSDGSETLVLKLPRHTLEARLSPTRKLIGRPFGSNAGLQIWVSTFVADLVNVVGNLDKSAQMVLQGQVLDLVALSLAEAGAGSSPRLTSSRSIALACGAKCY